MPGRRKSAEEVAWLESHAPQMTAPETRAAFEERFGWAPGLHALRVWASKRHLRFGRVSSSAEDRAAHIVRWSQEPEMEEWMLENDHGQSTRALSADFEARFGFPLSSPQISLFRSSHGTQTRRSHGGGRAPRPLGAERTTGKSGYIMVKVREAPTVPQPKDNWRFKHHLIWEWANGRELPRGWTVVFVNGDIRDFRPANLCAMPRKHMARLNQLRPASGWPDRKTLEAAVRHCDLVGAIRDASNRPRRCGVCGEMFAPDPHNRYGDQRTCRACLDAGHKASRHKTQPAVCERCGRPYERWTRRQRFCPECSTARSRRKRGPHAL